MLRLSEVAVLMIQVRDDLADALIRSGVPADGVREFRERGARIDGHGESTWSAARARAQARSSTRGL